MNAGGRQKRNTSAVFEKTDEY